MRSQLLTAPPAAPMAFVFFFFSPYSLFSCLLKRAGKTEQQILRPPGGKNRWNKSRETGQLAEQRILSPVNSPLGALPSYYVFHGHFKEAVRLQGSYPI